LLSCGLLLLALLLLVQLLILALLLLSDSLSCTTWSCCSWLDLLLLRWSWASGYSMPFAGCDSSSLVEQWKNCVLVCTGFVLVVWELLAPGRANLLHQQLHWVDVVLTTPQPSHGDWAACKQLLCLSSSLIWSLPHSLWRWGYQSVGCTLFCTSFLRIDTSLDHFNSMMQLTLIYLLLFIDFVLCRLQTKKN
jgi:hypothetical protein